VVRFRFALVCRKREGMVSSSMCGGFHPSNCKAATGLTEELVSVWQTLIYSTLNSRRLGRISDTPPLGNFLAASVNNEIFRRFELSGL